jgi:hypothetical protein
VGDATQGARSIDCRASRSEAATGQKRLSFALEFVASTSRKAGLAELADGLDLKSKATLGEWYRVAVVLTFFDGLAR